MAYLSPEFYMHTDNLLIIGALGQIGSELTSALRKIYGEQHVIASDIVEKRTLRNYEGIYEHLNVLDKERLKIIVRKYKINQVYLLAAILSARAEDNPHFAWRLNMESLFNVLELARDGLIQKIFWPSSIAVFGPTTPRRNTPQFTITEPITAYGISKLAGERWCAYYFRKFSVDVRSLRYPGLISYQTPPGGGTTDYAVDIFFKAVQYKSYTCYLKKNTYLPMMYMPDAIRATLELMAAPSSQIKIRSAYNVAAISFCPSELAAEIKKHIPEFRITYQPDFRQALADSWPQSIDDSPARKHWGWEPYYDLKKMTTDMLKNLRKTLQ
ncbi:MAG: L-threonine 3-dehydrogenase [Chitinophagales bacterium]|nr:MAG: L-threonine 3-dehydrogenase [Chitinophagales bacterium]